MKILALIIISSLTLQSSAQVKKTFQIKGKIKGNYSPYLFLAYSNKDGKWIRDSAIVQQGVFEFKGEIKEPSTALLGIDKIISLDDANSVSLFLEPTVMSLELTVNDFKNAKLTGSKSHFELVQLEKQKAGIYKQLEPLNKEYYEENKKFTTLRKAGASEATQDSIKNLLEEIRSRMEPYREQLTRTNLGYFRKNPNSYVTAYNLRFYIGDLTLDSLQWFYDNMSSEIQQSTYGKELDNEIVKLRGGSPGSIAKEFATIDIEGKAISLSEFKGKYVLLDFWASWCVPCRKGNPHLKELYSKYKEMGIEFIGVSDDDGNADAWRKAVTKDGLPWRHVLRGLDMQKRRNGEENLSDISEKFGIHVLPTKILIDKEGKIIGRFNEEEAPLDKLLEEIFSK